MKSRHFKTVILGGGAAGLSAARELARKDEDFVLLEARGRIGGRVFTEFDTVTQSTVELGAEFMHGRPQDILSLVNSTDIRLIDVADGHFKRGQKGLEKIENFWKRVEGVVPTLENGSNPTGVDRSYVQYLDAQKNVDPETRDLALGFVESFNAADGHDAGEHGLAIAGHTSEGSSAGVESSRFSVGYSSVVSRLLVGIENLEERLLLNREVTKIKWHKGRVEIETTHRLAGTRESFTAERAIITLPLGVLQDSILRNSGLMIDPVPETLKSAVLGLRMGSAVRMVLGFRSPVWEQSNPHSSNEPVGFLHGKAEDDFPIWWTSMPIRSNHITAWSGGARAHELIQLSLEEKVDRALKNLARILDREPEDLAGQLQTVHHHNWTADPYTRGAYSYVAVGGVEAARRFSEPVADTLYFAGEATFMGFSRGTVDGAISSGRRAVNQIFDR